MECARLRMHTYVQPMLLGYKYEYLQSDWLARKQDCWLSTTKKLLINPLTNFCIWGLVYLTDRGHCLIASLATSRLFVPLYARMWLYSCGPYLYVTIITAPFNDIAAGPLLLFRCPRYWPAGPDTTTSPLAGHRRYCINGIVDTAVPL